MKKTFLLILSVSVLLVLSATPALAQGRMATVDLKKLFDNYWKKKQAETALVNRGADLEKEFKAMMEDYKKAKEEYKKLTDGATDPAMSEIERNRKKQEAEDKLGNLKQQEEAMTKFQNQARTTIDEQRRRTRDNILGEIRKVIDGKSKVAGYSMVIDVAAETINSTPVILYSSGENDITDSVLSQLNASAPPEAQETGRSSNTATNK
jgi:outer membrane protein